MASKRLLVGLKIAISVLSSMALYTSNDTRLCVNGDCFDLPAFAIANFSQKKVQHWRF